ncbi:ethanolaminephosphotransferase 1 [Strongylocentrotus purpuratus]|uniref:Ethanolaminephosphotransferase n=1 Tax=Strongylocentrotus purpuratus TaxID=7668 RepID=A0A7M7NQY0_STRPU|nr:ethanolaminephosphotransferase 1 [Strongylocentrotus purpuratus]|eukprot:XP_788945.2 PREDICTED: ethanolaminephosphotransferase 1 [Strongylocentrotus purpuratus]
MAVKYLNKDHINGFDKYKYSSRDTSPVAVYVMHPFWNAVVKFYPMWLAPNLLTFVGFLFQVYLFLLLAYYDWDYYSGNRTKAEYPTIPNWVWYVAAVCQFLGHTLDGTDGKQARRTGSSTPLGELFDHGSDSILCALMPLGLFSIFGKGMDDYGGSSWIFFAVQWHVIGCFFVSHWEKYLTGVLFLPWSYDFSQVSIVIVYLLTGTFGFEVWKITLPYGIQFNYFFLGLVCAGAVVFSLPQSIYNIVRSFQTGSGKRRSLSEAATPLISMLALFGISTFWGLFSPTDVLEYHTRIYLLAVSTVFSNITVRLIISQMSDTLACLNNFLLMLFGGAAVAVCVLGIAEHEVLILHGLFAIILLLHFHYLVTVVNQLSDHFNIYAFSITSRPRQKNHVK